MFRRRAGILLLCAALLVCYVSFLKGMVEQWRTDEDMGHGFLVPIVIGWILWRERPRLRTVPPQPSNWGWAILALGAGLNCAATLGAGLFAGSLALLISVAGAVVLLGGFSRIRSLGFLFLLALFMLPKLAVVYNQATLPLQLLASHLAASGLTAAGIGVIRSGNILEVNHYRVEVAEACSGIRYLLPLGFLTLVFGYVSGARTWARTALLVMTIPVAIVANAARVALAVTNPALAVGAPHAITGGFIFMLCLAGLAFLSRIFKELHERIVA